MITWLTMSELFPFFAHILYMLFFRYHYPVPKIFYVQLSVGSHEFIGEGRTRQAARHNAAMKALQALRNEPIPERPPQVNTSTISYEQGGAYLVQPLFSCPVLALQMCTYTPNCTQCCNILSAFVNVNCC